LKGFQTKAENDCVYRYEKGSRVAKELPIKVVGSENDLYTPDVEKIITEKYENPANSVLDKLRRFEFPPDQDKILLVNYFLLLNQRTPAKREQTMKMVDEAISKQLEQYEKEKEAAIAEHPSRKGIIEKNFERVKELLTTENNLRDQVWQRNLGVNVYPMMLTALMSMNWCFVESPKNDSFVTCDAPFFYTKGIGLAKATSEVFFPVSTRLVLWLNWYPMKRNDVEATNAMRNEINKRMVATATRYVFFCAEEDWLKNYCSSEKLEMRHLDLPKLLKTQS
jgi:hypothetical protein